MAAGTEPGKTTRVLSFDQDAPAEKFFARQESQETSPEKTIAESFRAIVRDELSKCGVAVKEKEETLDLRPLQAIFLLAFALDLTFAYFWVSEHSKAGEVGEFLSKLLPALGGTLAISYFDRLRRWLLVHSRNPWFGALFLAPAVFFVVTLIPIYPLLVRVDAKSPALKEADTGTPFVCDPAGRCYLSGLKLRPYAVTLSDSDGVATPYTLGYSEILTSLARGLPLLHGLSPRVLQAKYKLEITYADPRGTLYVSADQAEDLDQPVQNGLSHTGPATPPLISASGFCWQKSIQGKMDELVLPHGTYTFTQQNNGRCWQTKAQLTGDDNLDFSSNVQEQQCN